MISTHDLGALPGTMVFGSDGQKIGRAGQARMRSSGSSRTTRAVPRYAMGGRDRPSRLRRSARARTTADAGARMPWTSNGTVRSAQGPRAPGAPPTQESRPVNPGRSRWGGSSG